MIKSLLFILSFFCFYTAAAQGHLQVIRGVVKDKDSKAPLPGATVALIENNEMLRGVSTNERGEFRLEQVSMGRYTLRISFIGYKPLVLPGITVTSGKEVLITAELEESVNEMKQVEVSGVKKEEAINEMAVVSARTFSIEETDRYAGSRGDPARMASNFAGVQGADDSRNDIVVRGNSPMGVLWRVDGIDIPNPNHFAVPGTTGGPVSILNNKVLANSDFLTGAFPAEYGNSIAGVFDVHMRSGNNEKHEFTGQFGFLGTELTAEGPISKEKRSSYLVNYRYSTLKLFESLQVPIGTSAVPNYQDAAFKLNFPTKKGNLSFFGLGGRSKIDIVLSRHTEQQEEIYGDKDRDQYFGTSMGVAGATYTHFISSTAFSRLTIAGSYSEAHSRHDLIHRDTDYRVTSLDTILGYRNQESKLTLSYFINKKITGAHTIKAGVFLHRFDYHMKDSLYNNNMGRFLTRLDHSANAFFLQPYVQWKYRITDELVVTGGLHGQYFTLNGSTSVEPRGGIRWAMTEKHSLAFGAGMHSQLQPSYIYFHQYSDTGNVVHHNRNLGFTRSNHFVLSYDYQIFRNTRFKAETYYQQLYNIPVEARTSAFSILNQGTGFTRFFPDSLVNEGSGRNLGIEFTLERFFSRNLFLLVTTSFFDSKYRGSDGILRNTDFNGRFATNFLVGKEFKVSKNGMLSLGTKITWAGGRRYTPVDIEESIAANEAVFIDSETNTKQFKDYFRKDLRISYRVNRKNISHEIALDLINVLNRKNIFALSFAPDPHNPSLNPLREEYQLGFLPLFYYKIDF